jgi:uncharacterized sporulation protein YeaH/YhbH (DUF444 family)
LILPVSQYFAYLEVSEADPPANMPDSPLWTLYKQLHAARAPLAMRRVSKRGEIFPVFQELFQRRRVQTDGAP